MSTTTDGAQVPRVAEIQRASVRLSLKTAARPLVNRDAASYYSRCQLPQQGTRREIHLQNSPTVMSLARFWIGETGQKPINLTSATK